MLKQCTWNHYSDLLADLPEGATGISGNDIGSQSRSSLNVEAAKYGDVIDVSFYLDTGGVVFAAVGYSDASIALFQRSCSGAVAPLYLVGLGLGAVAGGLIGAKVKPLRRYAPASTMIGVALGLVVGGVGAHLYNRRGFGESVAGPVGLIDAQRKTQRSIGSLYLPRGGGLPRDTRVGLVEATRRYMPRAKNW